MRGSFFFITILSIGILFNGALADSTSYTLEWTHNTSGWTRSAAVSSDGNYVVAGSGDTYIYFFNRHGELLWKQRTNSYINSVSISSDGSYIAAASDDSSVYFLDRNGTLMWYKKVGTRGATLVSLAGDGSFVAAASAHPDNRVYYFNKKGVMLWRYVIGDIIKGLSVSSNGSFIAASSINRNIYYFNGNGNLIWSYAAGIKGASAVSISHDGSFVATASWYNDVYILTNTGVLERSILFQSDIEQISLISNSTLIAAKGKDDVAYIYSRSGDLKKTFGLSDSVGWISFSENASVYVAGSAQPRVGVYFYSEKPVEPFVNISTDEVPKIFVLSNSIDKALAGDFFNYLKSVGFELVLFEAKEVDQYKNEKTIVILGGPDAPEGVGGIVEGLMDAYEKNNVRRDGSHGMYIKRDVWKKGQTIMILAGSDRFMTEISHKENREKISLIAAS